MENDLVPITISEKTLKRINELKRNKETPGEYCERLYEEQEREKELVPITIKEETLQTIKELKEKDESILSFIQRLFDEGLEKRKRGEKK